MQFVGGSYEEESTQHLWFSTTTIKATIGPYQRRREKPEPQASIPRNGFEWVGITLRKFCPRKGKWSDKSGKKTHQQASKPKGLPPRISYNCKQPGHFANKCPNHRQNKPHPSRQGSEANKSHHNKKPNIQVKQGQRDFMGIVSTWEHISLWLVIICCLRPTHHGLLMVMFMPLDALSYRC
jgi:hypothetical protein